jgi:radical SAM protein with 4Fe4S-binding SPASM domain
MSNILRANELTGIIGRDEIDKLSSENDLESWKTYRALYEYASNLNETEFPIQLDIELNASCNLKCPMCPISAESPKNKGKSTWFCFEHYKKIINFSVENGLKALKLNYVNEPLIRNDIFDFIKYAKEAGVLDVYLSTNGVLMNDLICEKLVLSGITRVQISIDATSKEIYDKLRPGGDFDLVKKNVDILLKTRSRLNSTTPLVRVNFVRTEINEFELEDFVEYWKNKVDMIGIQEFIKPTESSQVIKSKTSLNKRKQGFKCSFPFKQLVITNEKNVLPCCTFWGEKLAIQKLENPQDLIAIWKHPKIIWLREMHKAGKYYEIDECRSCVEGGLE